MRERRKVLFLCSAMVWIAGATIGISAFFAEPREFIAISWTILCVYTGLWLGYSIGNNNRHTDKQ